MTPIEAASVDATTVDDIETEWAGFFPELTGAIDIDEILVKVSGKPLRQYAADHERWRVGIAATRTERDTESAADPPHDDLRAEESVLRAFPFAATTDQRRALLELVIRHADLVDPAVAEPIIESMLAAVMRASMRCLAHELHRMRDAGELRGEDPGLRYDDFRRRATTTPFRQSLYRRFPGLPQQIDQIAAHWLSSIEEILAHVHAARTELEQLFGLAPSAVISRLELGSGDSHRGGRAVAILHFSCGTRIVYKPRSLTADIRFHELLEWCATLPGAALCPIPTYLDKGDHGFMEYLPPESTRDPIELGHYFERTGELTAVLYALNGCDVHYENLRTMRGNPVATDLETLFVEQLRDDSLSERTSPSAAIDCLSTSVLQVGTLPRVMHSRDGVSTYDASALGHRPARSPRKIHHVVDDFTDRMRIAFDYLDLDSGIALPTLEDSTDNSSLLDRFATGFECEYRRLVAHREQFATLVRELFDDIAVRYVNSETSFYVQLLRMLSNPSILRAPVAREILLHRVALRHRTRPPRLVRAEIDDLLDGDVPYFQARTSSTSLWDSRGTEIPDVFDTPPIEKVLTKIDRLGETDLALQLRLISSSMINKMPDDAVRTGLAPSASPPRRQVGRAHSRYRATAARIADFLVDTAFRGTTDIPTDWISLNVSRATDSHGWFPGTLGLDLYGGRPGIALALAAAAHATGEHRYADVAASAVEPLIGLARPGGDFHNERSASGLYMGHAGFARAIHGVGSLLGRDDLIGAAYETLATETSLIQHDKVFDIVMGTAGVLATAVHLHERAASDDHRRIAATIATRAAEKLSTERACIWPDDEPRMSGYAHGAAGYYPWLLAAGRLVGTNLDEPAEWFLEVERSMRTDDGDWQRTSHDPARSYAWCHGAPGILLAKEIAVRYRPDLLDSVSEEIQTARALTVQRGFGNNVTHCHGDLGTIEILRLHADRVGDEQLTERLDDTFERLHDDYLTSYLDRTDCRYALVNSLMIGQAGVLHALAGALSPETIESVLW